MHKYNTYAKIYNALHRKVATFTVLSSLGTLKAVGLAAPHLMERRIVSIHRLNVLWEPFQ